MDDNDYLFLVQEDQLSGSLNDREHQLVTKAAFLSNNHPRRNAGLPQLLEVSATGTGSPEVAMDLLTRFCCSITLSDP